MRLREGRWKLECDLNHTGHIIRQARERAGLTQAAAAEALDVSQPQWAQWESGARTPRLDTLARIADILDCELRIEMTPREDSC